MDTDWLREEIWDLGLNLAALNTLEETYHTKNSPIATYLSHEPVIIDPEPLNPGHICGAMCSVKQIMNSPYPRIITLPVIKLIYDLY